MRSFSTLKLMLALSVLTLICTQGKTQISITSTNTNYTENFDGMNSAAAATLPTGFKAAGNNTTQDWNLASTSTTLAAGTTGTGALTGTSSGGTYNFGNGISASASDRSLGFLTTGSYLSPCAIILKITNNTGVTVGSLTIGFDYEKYRSGSRAFTMNFFHGSSSTPTTPASAGDQSYAADAANTTIYNPPTTTSKSFTINGLSIANGASYYLKWVLTGSGGSTNGQAIGIDNFSINAAPFVSNDASLSALAISSGTLTPAFSGNTTSYSASVSYGTTSITITPTTNSNTASVTVNGTTTQSGTASSAISLNTGDNTIPVVVTAQDGTTTKSYSLTVTRAATFQPVFSTGTLSSFGNVCLNTSATSSFSLGGNDLDGTAINIGALDGFTYSETQNGTYTSTLSFSPGTSFSNKLIYVRFTPIAVLSYNGNIPISGGGTSASVAVSGAGFFNPATLITGAASGANGSSATVNATITNSGCGTISNYGFEYSTTTGFTNGSGTQINANNLSNGNFSALLSGLTANTIYYYKAFATSDAGTSYGAQQSFSAGPQPVVLTQQDNLVYTETFDNISSWSNGFTAGTGANHFSGIASTGSGTTPNPTLVTTSTTSFVSGSSGGVQKGSGSIILLSTGSSDNTSSAAIDLALDFTGVNAGSMSFDWAALSNSTGDRNGSLRVYATTNGTTWTELTGADVLNVANNSGASGTASVQLPASFNNSATAKLRFYYHNGTGGTGGSRPKISITNITVSSVGTTPCATPTAAPSNLQTSATETTAQISFSAASPAPNRYLVILSQNNSLTSSPIDGQAYSVGDNVGDGTVIAFNSNTQYTATGLTGGTSYYVFVFAANNICSDGPKYLASTVLTGTFTTQAGTPPCAAPAAQPTALQLTATTTTVQGSFTATTADEYLVIRSTSQTLSALPTNGVAYNIGSVIGNGTVAYRNNTTSFVATNLDPNTTWYFFVFSINSQNCTGGPVYNTVAPLSGSINTLPLSPCATPYTQPNSLVLHAGNTSISGSFNASATADHYLVLLSTSSDLNGAPVDNTDYTTGNAIGNGTVISSNSATSFTANGLIPSTAYYITVFAANKTCTGGTKYLAANPLTATISTTATPAYNVYFGNLHAHSDYSDGNKDHPGYTPADDYAYAMTAECMDFLGISEHNHFSSPDNPGNLITNYHQGSVQADTFTANHTNFLALYGMEWGVISGGGHVVVYGDGMDKLFGWESNVGGITGPNYDVYVAKSDYTGANGLFKTVNDFKQFNTFATLAHPNNTDYNNLSNSPYNLVADSAIVGSAVESGPATSTNTTYTNPSTMSYLWYFQKMLSLGYHLGPVIDHDNHNTTFGKTTRSRTAVLAPALTKTELVKAMREMRFYATEDCDTKVDFTVNNRVMGSIFTDRNAPAISVRLTDATTSLTGAKIRILYGAPGSGVLPVAIDSSIGSSFDGVHANLAVNTTGYYYADITNGSAHIVTSPIWYTRTCGFESDTVARACSSFDWYGTTYTTSGTITRHFTTAAGCDSLVTLHLTINTPSAGDTTAKVCEPLNWYGTTLSESGTYTHSLINAAGCDSTLTLHLTVNTKPTASITPDGPTSFCPSGSVKLTAATAASYLWSNGATTQAITANTTGDYSVTVTDENGCSATSAIQQVYAGDTIPPVIHAKNLTVYLNASGNVSITAADINDGSTDNCQFAADGVKISKSTFDCSNLGENTIVLTVTDASGNTASTNATVTVIDNIAPSFTAPAAADVNIGGNCSVTIPDLISNLSGSDNCGNVSFTQSPVAGSIVATTHNGAITVTITANDGHGNTSTQSVTLTAKDITAPVITAPANVSVNTDAGACNASNVALGSSVYSDNCSGATVTNNAPATFQKGVTTVIWTVQDAAGLTATASQTVTVTDNEKPVITNLPSNITLRSSTANSSACAQTATWIAPSASDNCQVTSFTSNYQSGASFPKGTTTVIYTAVDAGSNSATASFTVTVNDDTKPVIVTNGNKNVVNDAGKCGALVTVSATATDNCTTGLHPTGVRSDGLALNALFPVGVTSITWSVTDESGNNQTATQTVTVTDNEKPVLTCPTVPVLCYNSSNSYTIPALNAKDNCGIATVSFSITGATSRTGSGLNATGQFGEGTSTITWTVTDVHGNTASCSTSVFVDPHFTVSIPDVYAVNPGGNANTLYIGYGPSSLTLAASVTGGTPGYNYKWTVGSPAGPALNSTTAYSVSPSASTTYYFNVKDVYGCGAPLKTKTVNVQDVRCGSKLDKVTVCTLQKGFWTTTCVGSNNVQGYLNNGAYLGACTVNTSIVREEEPLDAFVSKLTASASPNPTTDQFTIITQSDVTSPITLRVYNALGVLVESRTGLPANGSVKIGTTYRPGVYLAEIIQGGNKVVIKLLK